MSEYLKQQKNDYTQPKSNSKNPDQIRAAQLKALEFQLQKRTLQKFAKDEGDEKQLKSQEEELQMKSGSGGEGSKTEMPEDVKSKMENSFGTDFSDVNIHKDSDQATNLGALAYTQGNDIHFAPGQYEPGSQKGQELLAHELTHVLQQREGRVKPETEQQKGLNINSNAALEKEADEAGAKAAQGKMTDVRGRGKAVQKQDRDELTPAEIISQAYADYKNGHITMPELARKVIPYAKENSSNILNILNDLDALTKDNFSYALSANATNMQLLEFDKSLLIQMFVSLSTELTFSYEENLKQREKVVIVLAIKDNPKPMLEEFYNVEPFNYLHTKIVRTLIEQFDETERTIYENKFFPKFVSADLAKTEKTLNKNITDNVGENQTNNANDVSKVAGGLEANGYTVNEASVNEGVCDSTMIQAIKDFEKDVLDRSGNNIKAFLTPKNWTGEYDVLFGKSPNTLNNTLDTWKREENYNAETDKTNYTINDDDFIDRDTYNEQISSIAEDYGIEKNSDDGKAITIAARAAGNEEYFKEFTKDVSSSLNLSKENVESHQVNPILKHRLQRFHKFLSAVGLFNGNMTGGACRSASTAHRWAIPHVVIDGMRPLASKESVENNVKDVYNGEAINGGSKDTDDNVKDSDGNIWAKPEHFNKNEEGEATSLKKEDWGKHLKEVSGRSRWGVFIAEGYKRGDNRRFPLGLQNSPGRSNHITGDAIDINSNGFLNKNDTKIDIIALYFGLTRPVTGEQWHFEPMNVALSDTEIETIDNSARNELN